MSLAFYSTLNCHGAFLSSWSSPFIFSFSLAVYSILNCHGASFSVVLALYIVLFFISTGLLLYSQLSWHILFLESSPFILYIFTGLSTLNCHGASFYFCFFALYILFCFTVTGLLLYSQLSCHNFVCLFHNLCISSTPILIFLKFDLSKSILLFFPLTTNFNFTFILFIIIPHKTPPTCPPMHVFAVFFVPFIFAVRVWVSGQTSTA